VRVVQGAARFKDATTLVVDSEDIEVRARRFVIGLIAGHPANQGACEYSLSN
jgi:hypothetical protein